MILSPKEAQMAYRCPKCGETVFALVGSFVLSADMLKVKCPCGASELTVTLTNDKKIRLVIPCLTCPKPHIHTLSSSVFFNDDVFCISCTFTGLGIFYVGDKEKLLSAVNRGEAEVVEVLESAGLGDFQSFLDAKTKYNEMNSENPIDPHMHSIINFVLHELSDEGKISCKCPDSGDYAFEFYGAEGDGVLVYCRKCSASVAIPIPDVAAANAFLEVDSLSLN